MPYKKWDEKDLLNKVSEDISNYKIVAWFQGGSEFGPRALGHRSIFANPCWVDVKKYLNEKIKYREGWRPYAPIVIEEELNEYFDAYDSPSNAYMLMSYEVKKTTKIPGVTHKDKTARVQTVTIKQNRRVYNLLKFIKSKIGVPILLNTSFNLGGEPIVETPKDALTTFTNSNIDVLVMENFYINKEE